MTMLSISSLKGDTIVFLLLLHFGLLFQEVQSDKNPCHEYRARLQYGCEKIILPQLFCQTCGIGPYTSTGDFLDCTRTTNLESTPQCVDKFQAYISLNPCDVKRKQALNFYQSSDPVIKDRGRQMLDYFVYAICEDGCDCIPQEDADPHARTMDASRGNCQAHLFYDTCKLFPDLKLMQLNGSAYVNETALSPVCPVVSEWMKTADARDFLSVPHTTVDPKVQLFMNHAWQAQQMFDSDYWMQCYNMETAQSRIELYIEPPSSSPSFTPSMAPSFLPSMAPSSAPISTPPFTTIRINAGNLTLNFTDKNGHLWLTDRYFVNSSSTFNKYVNIFGTVDDELYQTERNNIGPLQYEIPVPHPGQYNVSLGFSEIYFVSSGKRIFDVNVEGVLLYDNLDIVAVAGRNRSPLILKTTATVTDGSVTIRLLPVKSKPKISWIQIDPF